jgi:hypothetical protein
MEINGACTTPAEFHCQNSDVTIRITIRIPVRVLDE